MISIAIGASCSRRPRFVLMPALVLVLSIVTFPQEQSGERAALSVLGTWTGTSTCVGNHPACKNEEVVYRFLEIANRPRVVNLLADKIIAGKRVPMGALEFTVAEDGKTLTCEFTRGHTHGIWEYTVSGDQMTGTLVILPEKELGRRVSVHRVAEDKLPKAPSLDDYGT